MNMINRNKLRGLMAEQKITQTKLAKELGISKNSLNTKINGKSVFNENEISKISNLLGIDAGFLFENKFVKNTN